MCVLLITVAAVLISVGACESTGQWWKPTPGISWQITLAKPLIQPFPNVSVFDFDLFDNTNTTVDAVHQFRNPHTGQLGKVICYFSAGSWENWRPDASEFPESVLGKPLEHWKGERWLDVRSPITRKIMVQRIELAKAKGCDAIDPDNVDAYDNGGGGFNLTKADAIDYVKFLAEEGHKQGMATGLKNAGEIIPNVLQNVDFQVNEQCWQYQECDTFRPFIEAKKPVFEIEYKAGTPSQTFISHVCDNPARKGFSTLIKHLKLNYFFIACPAKV